MNKAEVRKEGLIKRATLSSIEVSKYSAVLADLFFTTFLPKHPNIKNIHLFLPIEEKNEINTLPIFKKLKNEYPEIIIALSRCDFKNNTMTLFKYIENIPFKKNKYGIPEPTGGLEIAPETLDLIILPLLAVDQQGNRVGYGKGFYDRLLAKCNPNCIFLGLSFDEPIPKIDSEKFDIPIHYTLTNSKLYCFKKK